VDPRLLLWTGKPLARLGDSSSVRRLLDAARSRARASDKAQVAAVAALDAELQLLRGDAAGASTLAASAVSGDSSAYVVETLAFALARAGRVDDARASYAGLATSMHGAVGKEGQQFVRLAPLAVARLDLARGRTADARATLDAFLAQLPEARSFPAVTSLRTQLDADMLRPDAPRSTVLPR
jgi:ATP/maltotriose-dependent transcriptional regulator MalT